MQSFVVIFLAAFSLFITQPVEALIVINEVLADPAAGILGDANGDGITSSSQDEFIEIVNLSNADVNLFGWVLSDGFKVRHTFPMDSILPAYEFLVVFGGGSPTLMTGTIQTASSGALGLNNSSDEVTLFDHNGMIIDQVSYGSEGGENQSLVRSPDGFGQEFLLHSNAPESAGTLFSPGSTVDGRDSLAMNTAAVPEASTLISLAFGVASLWMKKRHLC